MFEYGEQQIKALLTAIFTGKITEYDLPVSLYQAIAEFLKKGVYKGFGYSISSLTKEIGKKSTKVDLSDLELLSELRTNVYMFSAAKTYQQVKEMSAAVVDGNGTVVSFNVFKEKAEQTFDLYNKTWLKTEYETAIGQAQNAVKWNSIEKQADILPLLKYDAVVDKNTSEICRPLHGLVAPVKDPIWRKIMPLNHFNCRCLVHQLSEGEEMLTSDKHKQKVFNEATEQMQDVFKMNAGQDGYIFKQDHPYFTVPKKDKAYAKQNFDLPIPKKD